MSKTLKSKWQQHREFAEAVTVQGPYRGDCPFCKGKNTFTASKELGTLKYNCYKLMCDVGGRFDTDMTAAEIRSYMDRGPVPSKKDVETMEIPAQLVQPTPQHTKHNRFMRRWGIVVQTLYDVQQERVVFPIYHKGRMIDAVGRAVGERQHPKWYRYTGAAHYYTIGDGEVMLIVEDVISAIVAYQELPNVTCMAILGTSMNHRHFEKIGEYSQAVIALDPDAVGKTIEYRREIELWTGRKTQALNLTDDIKYRMAEDMESLQEICKR
jgi:hypothetical protein